MTRRPISPFPTRTATSSASRISPGAACVVYFYPADDTPGCTKEACQFTERFDGFSKAGVDVVGISPDGADRHRRFREKYGLQVRLLSDPSHEVMESYGAWGEKVLYGRKSVGVIRSTVLIGPDGRVVARLVPRPCRRSRREGARRRHRLRVATAASMVALTAVARTADRLRCACDLR